MALDCFQPFFLDYFAPEEDYFYKSTAPSEEIWKKFELLPTPPMSPERTMSAIAPQSPPGDKPSWRAKGSVTDEDTEAASIPDSERLLGNLSSIIIRDCMWSGFCASKQLEKVNGRASASVHAVVPPVAQRQGVKAQCASAAGLLSAPAADCVDPAAVLAYPASSCRKSASSGSESRSDSSDDEEEIDVVTVESKQNRVQLMNPRKPGTLMIRADPCPKRFHMSVHRQQHNYAARSPDSDPEDDEEEVEDEDDDDEEPQSKRSRATSPDQPCSSRSSSPSETSQNSDTEDSDRRKNHNFLERKRRNDLKFRFLALRDQIPGLELTKTPKVAILTRATEYLMKLHNKEKRQLQERKRLRARRDQLLRKISDLRRS